MDLRTASPAWFAAPSPAVRPRLRWSWPGTAVEDAELENEVAEMAEAGIGGAEICNIEYGLPPLGHPPSTFEWGSERWAAHIGAALGAARRHDFGIDLTIGPGWPWSSPAVAGNDLALGAHELLRADLPLEGPMSFREPVPRLALLREQSASLVAVTAARLLPTAGSGRRELDPGTAVDLTASIDELGCVAWEVPVGDWVLFAHWQQPTGQRARCAIPNIWETPPALDHMNRAAAEAALEFLERQLVEPLGEQSEWIGELFEDSLELLADGHYWTPSFLEEFEQRRGYDLTPHLPVLLRQRPSGEEPESPGPRPYHYPGAAAERIRRDYHQTVTDLWIDGHLRPTREWANRHGMTTRVQVYGVNFDNIAAAMEVDVPETEDLYSNTIDFWRTIASGAHLSGAAKVSMEHGVVYGADYMMTLREFKRRADKAFAAGVNQIVTSGYPYRWAHGARWPTWTPWASPWLLDGSMGFSEMWSSANPQWPHLPPLAAYLGRAQALLQRGRPAADVAIYRDVYGYPSEFGKLGTRVPLGVDPPEPALNDGLTRLGFSFDFINPATLAAAGTAFRDGRLEVQEPGYRALVVDLDSSLRGVVDHSRAMPGAAATRLLELAREGLPVVFVGRFPERGVGYAAADREDEEVRAAVAELRGLPNVRLAEDAAAVPAALAELGVSGGLAFDRPCEIVSTRRTTEEGEFWFLFNRGSCEERVVASFEAPSVAAASRWDLWTGAVEPFGRYRVADGRLELPLAIAPEESLVVAVEATERPHVEDGEDEALVVSGELRLRAGAGEELELREWSLAVDAVDPAGGHRVELELTELADWREIESLRQVSGAGVYRTSFEPAPDWSEEGRGAYLELGLVHGGVQVSLNGELVSPASVAPRRFDLGGLLRGGANELEIELTTTLKNQVDSLTEDPGFAYLAGRPERSQPYGLLGPVRLIPYSERGPDAG